MSIDATGSSDVIRQKYEGLKALLSGYGRVVVAFSGGADSTLLLAAAQEAGLEEVLAVTLESVFFTQAERRRVRDLARDLGASHLCVDVDILADPDVVQNDPRRCYHCKKKGFSLIRELGVSQGIHTLLHGINTDDLDQDRPGMAAARELGFKAPLVAAGFSKPEVRACSKGLGLITWDLPSQSCLATRIPSGIRITAQDLARVEQAEQFLHQAGLAQVRVRCHGNLARIEVLDRDRHRFSESGFRREVLKGLKALGFEFSALDLKGYGKAGI